MTREARRRIRWLAVAWIALAGPAAHAHEAPASPETGSPFPGLVVPSGGGRTLHVLGETLTVKAGPDDTAGAYAIVEEQSPPGGGSRFHTHASEDELFYVLEGTVEFRLGEETWTAGPGATALLPRGVPHAFRNVGSEPSRVLVIVAPGRFLGFFEEIDALSQRKEVTPADAARIGAGHDLTLHPPPGPN